MNLKRLTHKPYGPQTKILIEWEEIGDIIRRLGRIEDILGEEYDLDYLSQLVNQRMTMREDVAERMKLVGNIPLNRLHELVTHNK